MQRSGRKAAQSEATRRLLVSVAAELFAERGYAGVGTEEIVRRAGVTRGALYHHFTDKRDLFRAVDEHIETELVRGIRSRIAGRRDPWDLLVAGFLAFLDACLDPTVTRVTMIDGPAVLGWAEWRAIGLRHGLASVTPAVRMAMEAGIIARQPVEPLALLLHAALTEAGLHVATAADPAAARAEVEPPLLALLNGIRPPES
jgi:AcrR family transcriptional regulator